jgi:small subunit ribosomal protein S27
MFQVEMFTETLKELPQEGASADELKRKFLHLLKELDSLGLVTDNDLHEAVVNKVKPMVNCKEKEAVEEQCKVYKEWETQKQRLLQEQLEELTRQQRLAKVQVEKEALLKREEILFFFDNEEKYELDIEKKRVFYRRRYFGKRKKPRVADDNYIPPEVKASKS